MTAQTTLPPQPWMTVPATRAVMAALAPGGAPRFVGGCVRDALCGLARLGDIDIATPAPPDQVMDLLAAAKIRAIPTGIAHGTVTAVVGPAHFEITTLRRDVRTYGRHADVVFTDDWREDAARRDFTINAMSLSETGELFDYFDGREDLAAGRVRFVGDPATRIREDVLRLLRFFRFHAYYGKGDPDPAALAAAAEAAHLAPGLSGERIWAELSRILMATDPAAALTLMESAGVLIHILPHRPDSGRRGIARLAALVALEGAEGLAETPDAIRHLAAVLDNDAGAAEATAERLKLSRDARVRLARLVVAGTSIAADMEAAEARHVIYRDGAEPFRDGVLLSWAAELAEGRDAHSARDAAVAYGALLEVARIFVPPEFPLTGADAAAAGLASGPAMGEALRAVEDWWLARDFRPGRDDLLARLRAEASKR
ncbi:MAG: CCA tRNA nucleotidyltransferase [Alphaproteobacteria bacterium]